MLGQVTHSISSNGNFKSYGITRYLNESLELNLAPKRHYENSVVGKKHMLYSRPFAVKNKMQLNMS